MKTIYTLFILMTFISCGKNPLQEKETEYVVTPSTAEPYSYEMFEKGCTTGAHTFSTLKLTCDALADEEINNNCASEERQRLYDAHDCGQDFAALDSQELTYELFKSDCTTGKQSFSSFDDICNGLADEGLNNSCAAQERESLYKQYACPGDFTV